MCDKITHDKYKHTTVSHEKHNAVVVSHDKHDAVRTILDKCQTTTATHDKHDVVVGARVSARAQSHGDRPTKWRPQMTSRAPK